MTLREKIIHESLRQFCIKGFLNTSITEIIAAVGSSKGGLYNHFQSKEQLFLSALSEARKIWRDINLAGVDGVRRPIDKIKCILKNYRDCYLPDSKNLPGGCRKVQANDPAVVGPRERGRPAAARGQHPAGYRDGFFWAVGSVCDVHFG